MPPVAAHDYVASSSLQPDVTHVDTLRKTKKKKKLPKKKGEKTRKVSPEKCYMCHMGQVKAISRRRRGLAGRGK